MKGAERIGGALVLRKVFKAVQSLGTQRVRISWKVVQCKQLPFESWPLGLWIYVVHCGA